MKKLLLIITLMTLLYSCGESSDSNNTSDDPNETASEY